MADTEILNAILHYKKNIEKISTTPERALRNEDRLLHCISKLLRIPVTVKHLHETGVGRTVNALRKIEGNKGLAHAAKALVAKWKYMVIKEDTETAEKNDNFDKIKFIREAERNLKETTEKHYKLSETENSLDKKRKYEVESERQYKKFCSDTSEADDCDQNTYSPTKKTMSNRTIEVDHKSKEKSESSSKRYSDSSKHHVDSSKHHSESSRHHSDSSKHHVDSSKHHSESSRHHSDSSKHHSNSSKHHSSSSKHNSDSSNYHKSKNSKSEDSNNKHGSSKSNNSKSHTSSSKRKHADSEGIDCSSGSSFAAALGPMVVKKSKKSSKPSHSSTSSSKSSTTPKVHFTEMKSVSDKSELLDSPSALEPLDLDLMESLPASPEDNDTVSMLPVPVPNYKPRPSCHIDLSPKRKVQSEDDALISIMSNKNTRTKVYSGVKGVWTHVPTLFELTCRVLQQNFDGIEHTGGIPYLIMKPILDGVSAAQLYQFEHYNPYILEDTDHLWKFHVNKEFRSDKRQEMETWREMYLRCLDEREQKYKVVTANIQKTIKQSVPVRQTKLAYVDNPKPPRNILKKQLKNGTTLPDHARLLNRANAVRVPAPKQLVDRETPQIFKIKPKVAPLMQKTLKSIKMTRFKR